MVSRKTMKRFQATENSRHHLKDTFTYKGADGRCYKTEQEVEAPAEITERDIYHARKHEQMSMVELFRIERFLTDGIRKKVSYVPDRERGRILSEYPIEYVQEQTRYMGCLEEVWKILVAKFPETAMQFKNYKECQYALKYGAVPCEWGK